MEAVQQLAKQQRLTDAQTCAERAVAKYRGNRDLSFQLARVRAWNGDSEAAFAEVQRWPLTDLEAMLLIGDLHWYAADLTAARKSYWDAVRTYGEEAVGETVMARLMAEHAPVERSRVQVGLQSHHVQERFENTDFNTRIANETEFQVQVKNPKHRLALRADRLAREFGNEVELFDVATTLEWEHTLSSDVHMTLAYSRVYIPTLRYRHQQEIGVKYFLGKGLDCGGALRRSVYEDDVWMLMPQANYYWKQFGFGLTGFVPVSEKGGSLLLNIVYEGSHATGTVFVSSGNEIATNVFRSSGERYDGEQRFQTIGSWLRFALTKSWALRFSISNRQERVAYRRSSAGMGVEWIN